MTKKEALVEIREHLIPEYEEESVQAISEILDKLLEPQKRYSQYEFTIDQEVIEKKRIKSVNHPDHYNKGKIECIDAIDSAIVGLDADEAFYTGIVIKYLFRWKWKNGVEDIDKAIWYLNRLKEKILVEKRGEKAYHNNGEEINDSERKED